MTTTPTSNVAETLRARIRREGPLPVAEIMAAVADAYYGKGTVFGRDGDFITAPEISQVFGELIGLWCAVVWERMGKPASFRLVECGPGRGTLMADARRATVRIPGFAAAADIHLVERSATLRDAQRKALSDAQVTWHDDLATVPPGPMILIANEFADALPIHQLARTTNGWNERHVDVKDDSFVFVDLPAHTLPTSLPQANPGEIFETSPATHAWITTVAQRITRDGGAALVIDYGHTATATGETLQAVKQHRFHPALSDLGSADLTAHVDFDALGHAARATGATILGPVAQGTWLSQLGITVRTAQLTKGKPAPRAAEIAQAARRLTAPDAMGLLFKVMAVVHPDIANPTLAPLDGFAQDAAP